MSSATKLREKNPDMNWYILKKINIGNIKWVFWSCNNHYSKSKVPPTSAVNDMQFPEKPAFFDWKGLEYNVHKN